MSHATIDYDVADAIATITLSRRDKLNAFTIAMMDELLAVRDRVDADGAVPAVIFTGDGHAFCAGADLSEGSRRLSSRSCCNMSAGTFPRPASATTKASPVPASPSE